MSDETECVSEEEAALVRVGFILGMARCVDSIRTIAFNCSEPDGPCSDCMTAIGVSGVLEKLIEDHAREWGMPIPTEVQGGVQ
jgi:hypothetical protein